MAEGHACQTRVHCSKLCVHFMCAGGWEQACRRSRGWGWDEVMADHRQALALKRSTGRRQQAASC